MLFDDRRDAGRQLAARLVAAKPERPVVLALPRGGVPVGFEVAQALHAPLDLVLVRKIAAPQQEELTVGAVAEGNLPQFVTDQSLVAHLGVSPDDLADRKAGALREIDRCRRAYLGDRQPMGIAGCTAILVDDGIATAATMRAALRTTRRRRPARLMLAVPVAPADTPRRLRKEVDETACLYSSANFHAFGSLPVRRASFWMPPSCAKCRFSPAARRLTPSASARILPDPKQVYRRREGGIAVGDVIALVEEPPHAGEPLAGPVLRQGRRIAAHPRTSRSARHWRGVSARFVRMRMLAHSEQKAPGGRNTDARAHARPLSPID